MRWWICCLVSVRVSAQSVTDQMFWYTVPALCGDSSFNAFSGRVNPSNLVNCKSMQFGALSGRNVFVDELSFHHVVVVSPLMGGSASVSAQLFRGAAFRQTVVSVAYARGLGFGSVGGAIDMINSSVSGYHAETIYSVQSGFSFRLSKDLYSSLCARYFSGRKESSQTSRSPFHFLVGLRYQCSDLVSLSATAIKNSKDRVSSSILLLYQVHPRCNLRMGFRDARYPVIGASYRIGKLDLSFVFSYHEPLGLESTLALQYDTGRGAIEQK